MKHCFYAAVYLFAAASIFADIQTLADVRAVDATAWLWISLFIRYAFVLIWLALGIRQITLANQSLSQ